MKISDEERREVAAKLRALEPWAHFEVGEPITREEFEEALGLEYVIGDSYDAVGIRRLADLIERPTCKNVSDFGNHTVTQGDYFKCEVFDFVCDRCGVHLIGDEMCNSPLLECKLGHHAPLHYCPNCGAKVVGDD